MKKKGIGGGLCPPPIPSQFPIYPFNRYLALKLTFSQFAPLLTLAGLPIEQLDEEECLADMDGHGWTDWRTAHECVCYECPGKCHPSRFDYETYFAGRFKWVDGEKRVFVTKGVYIIREHARDSKDKSRQRTLNEIV